jgi:hypothetical protein
MTEATLTQLRLSIIQLCHAAQPHSLTLDMLRNALAPIPLFRGVDTQAVHVQANYLAQAQPAALVALSRDAVNPSVVRIAATEAGRVALVDAGLL